MIPDEAIEAAHKAWREQAALDGSIFEYNLRAAIEAAAPHMLAAVKAEAWDECVAHAAEMGCLHEFDAPDMHSSNPYRATK